MIIVEGVDGSGKTTLALELAKARRMVLMKNCIRPEDAKEIMGWMQLLRQFQPNNRLIVDRVPVVSEIVYGETMREKALIKRRDTFITLLALAPTIIYCRPSLENIEAYALRNDQMDGVLDKLPELVAAYDDLMDRLENHLDLRVIRYDWTADSIADLNNEIDQGGA